MSGTFWGEMIAGIRAEQGLSQRELAAATKVARSTLRSIESGHAPGEISTIEKLLDYLGYDLDALERDGQRTRREEIAADPKQRSRLAMRNVLKARLM